MYQAVINETVPAIAQADDSDGALGGCLSLAIEGLSEGAKRQGETEREALLTYCIGCARRKEFRGWEWEWDLLGIAAGIVDTPTRRALFAWALADIEAEFRRPSEYEFYNDYGLKHIALFELEMIERFNGKAAARVLRSQVHLNRLRMLLIERCIEEAAFDEAMRLIQEGIVSSEQRRLPVSKSISGAAR